MDKIPVGARHLARSMGVARVEEAAQQQNDIPSPTYSCTTLLKHHRIRSLHQACVLSLMPVNDASGLICDAWKRQHNYYANFVTPNCCCQRMLAADWQFGSKQLVPDDAQGHFPGEDSFPRVEGGGY